jgi:histone H3/H4
MISKNKIKEIAKEFKKKLSKSAYEKLEKNIYLIVKENLKEAAINADFNARKIIQSEDLEN